MIISIQDIRRCQLKSLNEQQPGKLRLLSYDRAQEAFISCGQSTVQDPNINAQIIPKTKRTTNRAIFSYK
jgi:hypothetical protein